MKLSLKDFFLSEGDALDLMRIHRRASQAAGKSEPKKKQSTKFKVTAGDARQGAGEGSLIGYFDTHDEALRVGAEYDRKMGFDPEGPTGAIIDEVPASEADAADVEKDFFDRGDRADKGSKLSRPQNCHGQELPIDDRGWPAGTKSWSNEGSVNEFEDPTSSKHAEGDSKWSSPKSSRSGMPKEIPQDDSQERSSSAWQEMRADGEDEYPVEKGHDLKHFFGDDPHPKSSRKVSEAEGDDDDAEFDRMYSDPDMGLAGKSGKKPREEPEKGDDDLFGGMDIDSDPDVQAYIDSLASKQQARTDSPAPKMKDTVRTGDDAPEQKGLQEPEFRKKYGAIPRPSEPSPEDADREEFLARAFGTKGSSRRGSAKDDFVSADPERRSRFLSPKRQDDEPEEDPEDGSEAPQGGGSIDDLGSSADDMTWDEFQASDPDAAHELEREVPDENERTSGFFKKRPDGRMYFTSATGDRKAWLGDDLGWSEMDDGGTPAGEF